MSGAVRHSPAGRSRKTSSGGFTLLELTLVLVIFSLAVALASPYISSGLTGVTVRATSKKIASTLNHARVLALTNRQNYSVRFTGKQVVAGPAKGTGTVKELTIPDEVRIEARDGSVIVFYPGGGSSGGGFEVKGPRDSGNYTITVEPSTGSVKAYPSHEKISRTDGGI